MVYKKSGNYKPLNRGCKKIDKKLTYWFNKDIIAIYFFCFFSLFYWLSPQFIIKKDFVWKRGGCFTTLSAEIFFRHKYDFCTPSDLLKTGKNYLHKQKGYTFTATDLALELPYILKEFNSWL